MVWEGWGIDGRTIRAQATVFEDGRLATMPSSRKEGFASCFLDAQCGKREVGRERSAPLLCLR